MGNSSIWIKGSLFYATSGTLISFYKSFSLFFVFILWNQTNLFGQGSLEIEKKSDYSFIKVPLTNQYKTVFVEDIARDSFGFMWFATFDGLFRYDGKSIKEIHEQLPKEANDEYYSLCSDLKGRLWASTSYSICRISNPDKIDKSYRIPIQDSTNSSRNLMNQLLSDQDGNIWMATWDRGLLRFDPGSEQWTHFKANPASPDGLRSHTVRCIFQDKTGTIWIGSHDGLLVWNKLKDKLEQVTLIQKNLPHKGFLEINTIFEDSKGIFWLGSNHGFIRFDKVTRKMSFFELKKSSDQIDANIVEAINEDKEGRLWIGTRDGLHIFDKDGVFLLYSTYGKKESQDGLYSPDIRVIYNDGQGLLWIGSHSGGVNKYIMNQKKFNSIIFKSDKIEDNRIFSVADPMNGLVYLGSERGLHQVNTANGSVKTYRFDPRNPSSLSNNLVNGISIDNKGNLWLGTDKGGLNYFNTKENRFIRYFYEGVKPETYSENDIWDVYCDRQGIVWLCMGGKGLIRFSPNSGETKSFQHSESDSNSISGNIVGCILEDLKGRFWIGTFGSGLNCFDPQTGIFTKYKSLPGERNSLSSNSINSLYLDQSRYLWIGTTSGLDRLDIIDGTIQNFNQENGLSSQVRSLAGDRKGDVWVATDDGIFKLDSKSLQFLHYTTQDGLPSVQFISGSVFQNDNGTIYFGSENGLVYFNPEEIINNQIPPRLGLTGIKILDEYIQHPPQSFNGLPEIELNYKQNFISFEFSALDFEQPDKNMYKWYLEGLENNYGKPTNQNFAVYNNLKPSRYVFHLMGSNNDGVWSEKELSIVIIIQPPFYETIWFRFLILFITLSLIFVFINFRIRQLSAQKILLEKMVSERTQTIVHQKEDLEKANSRLEEQKNEISKQAEYLQDVNNQLKDQQQKIYEQTLRLEELDKSKNRLFTNISHEFRTPLTLIIGPLEKLMKESSDPNLKKQYEIMIRNANRLLRLINQLLELSMLDAGQVKLKAGKGDVSTFLKNISEAFSFRADKSGILFMIDISLDNPQIIFDADKLEKIVFNLLSNAFKYTPAGGSVLLSARFEHLISSKFENLGLIKHLIIKILDTGIGIPESHINQIFDRFHRVDTDSSSQLAGGTGIGLSLTKELVNTCNGKINVRSEIGHGSEFVVFIPMDDRCFSQDEIVTVEIPESELINRTSQALEHTNPITRNFIGDSDSFESQELPTILLIEDDKDLCNFINESFKKKYKIDIATNGTEGLNTAFEIIPDLIISDIMLPGEDGFNICRILKSDERTSHIPIILLTARVGESDKISGLESGADDYITKPFDVNLLEIKIKNLIEQRKKLIQRYGKVVTLQPSNIKISKPDESFLEKAMDIIEKNIENNLFDVEQFTREIGVSRTLLYRKIKALTNQSINDFIRSIRLKRAAQLLQTGAYNISEVALRTGFTTQGYFSKCFEQQFGELPSKYANRYKSGGEK